MCERDVEVMGLWVLAAEILSGFVPRDQNDLCLRLARSFECCMQNKMVKLAVLLRGA